MVSRPNPPRKVHSEIEYIREDGVYVHSDICPPNCTHSEITPEYRNFLHACLDEWLDKGGGTGKFYISEEDKE